MVELEIAIRSLADYNVDFVIIGGVAMTAYGSAYVTQDLDFCYSRLPSNLTKLVQSLAAFNPRPRDFPTGLPFVWDERTLMNGSNFTLETSIGDIDLIGDVSGVGDFEAVRRSSQTLKICGVFVEVISLDDLIRAKRSAGRTKDLLALPELEALLELYSEDEDEPDA